MGALYAPRNNLQALRSLASKNGRAPGRSAKSYYHFPLPTRFICYISRMALVIVGLGNSGKEYEKTRHNAGRTAVELVAKGNGFDDFVFNKTANALVSKGAIESETATLVLPETMVNLSGKAVSAFIKTPKAAKNLLLVHDDLDLPLGTIKMVFARGSGGHKGGESVMRAVKTQDFAR